MDIKLIDKNLEKFGTLLLFIKNPPVISSLFEENKTIEKVYEYCNSCFDCNICK